MEQVLVLHGQADRVENTTAMTRVWLIVRPESLSCSTFMSVISDFSPTVQAYTMDQEDGPENIFHYSVLHLQ